MHIQDVLPRNAIPSIDTPEFGTEYIGDGDDEVIAVETTPARAYPVRILSHHEIVNDVLEGGERPDQETDSPGDSSGGSRPIAVTWCPICASAVVYDRRVGGRVLTFGTSGKLADDALVMYDRETESEWKQPLGQAIDGPLGGTCLNRGCIPSKMLLYHADVLETIERAGEFHIDAEMTNVDFTDIVREVNEEVEADAESILKN